MTKNQHIPTADLLAFINDENAGSPADFMTEHGFEGLSFDYSLGLLDSVTLVALPGVSDAVARAGYDEMFMTGGSPKPMRLDVPGSLVFARSNVTMWTSNWTIIGADGTVKTVPNIDVAFDVAERISN